MIGGIKNETKIVCRIGSCAGNKEATVWSTESVPYISEVETTVEETSSSNDEPSTEYAIAACFGPQTFASHADLAAYIHENNCKNADHYYIPQILWEAGTVPRSIQMRPDTYITVFFDYRLESQQDAKQQEGDYDAERLGQIICQTYLFTDPQTALNNFVPHFPDCKPVEYHGQTFYYMPEKSPSDSSFLIGHSVFLIIEDRMIYLHVSGQESFEEMLRYTELIRVDTERMTVPMN